MPQLPDGVVPSDAGVSLFYSILKDAYLSVSTSLDSANLTTVARRKRVMKQVQEIVKEADQNVQAWIKVEIPAFYEMGMQEALLDLNERGSAVRIDKGFANFHREAIEALAQDTYQNVSSGMAGMTRTAERVISMSARESITTQIAKGQITGADTRSIAKQVENVLKAEGLSAITDKNGRKWDLMRYGEMLTRTKLTQAHNSGTVNRMVESGYDLVIVSSHGGSCDLCAPFEGKILSATGRNKGYISLDEAQSEGLFHPNCRHVITPYHDRFLDASVGWDTEKQKYVPFEQVTINRRKVDFGTKFDDAVDPNLKALGGGSVLEAYKTAFNSGDLKALEAIRSQNPEDARFNTHLKFLKTSIRSEGTNNYDKIKKLHEQINRDIGIEGVAEFNRLLEGPNKKKVEDYVASLPKTNPNKSAMERLLKFL